ncbi:putative ribonuclease H-like domain-containing protein [Tanacetum coccineum]
MTGNKEKLDDFVQIKGGIVKFGGGDGRISGKGTIRTSKLDFENVYYVEELQHFNLFSVSQICDKKNKVLFTDTDCFGDSEEFNYSDEAVYSEFLGNMISTHSASQTCNQNKRSFLSIVLVLRNAKQIMLKSVAKLPRQEFEAKDAAARYGLFGILLGHLSLRGVTAGKTSAGSVPTDGNPAGPFQTAGSYDPAALGDPAAVHRILLTHFLESIFATKRVNTIHPQSQILGDLASPVLTRSRAQKSKFGESAFIGYIQDQQRTNHTDQLHCLSACFLSQLEPTSIAKALEDPDWVDAMQEEMQQFINQQVWKLVPLPDGKHAIGTKWILKNKRDARGIVVRNKARLVAQGHRQEEGIDYDEVFAPGQNRAIRLFLAYASYMGFLEEVLIDKTHFIKKDYEGYTSSYACSRHQVTTPLTSHLNAVKKIFKSSKRRLISWQLHEADYVANFIYKKRVCCWLLAAVHKYSAEDSPHDNVADLLTKAFEGPSSTIQLQLSFLLDALFLLVAMDYAAGSVYMLEGIYCCVFNSADRAEYFLPVCMVFCCWSYLSARSEYIHAAERCAHFDIAGCLVSPLSTWFSAGSLYSCWCNNVSLPEYCRHDLVATIDGREVVVTESLIRTQLHFDDANGIFDMPNSDILEGMRVIGYPTDRALTFLKHHLSPQWRFLVHTLMHCLSPKSGSWNQFPSSIATALICLSTDRVYNFSRFIIEGMIGNVKATKNKFLMYPRFLQMIVAIETADRTPRPTFGFTRKLKSCAQEWVVPNPVSPVTDWRPWPSVPAHSPIRDPTPEPASPPTPPAQTFIFKDPLVFGPPPRPAGDVDPDPEDLDNLFSMEDDTTHGGFHVESPCSARMMLPNNQQPMQLSQEAIENGLSSSEPQLVGDVPSSEEEREEEEVPLRRKRSAYRRARTVFSTPAFEQFQAYLSAGPSDAADKGKAPMPDLEIPAEFLAEDAQARKRFEEEQASERLVQQLQAEDLVQADLPNVFEERAKELDDLMMRYRHVECFKYNLFRPKPAITSLFLSDKGVDHDEVLAEILFRGKYISGAGVVVVDKLPDDEIVDPRVKVETVSDYASSPPRSRRKHRGVRSDDFLWDKPVEDFFSSESESDDDMEHYIPPLPYGEFKDWEMVSCPPGNNHIHVYYQQNRRRKYFTYLKELLPHVYREDLLLLRRRMNRYFRLNPDVDVGLDLWRDEVLPKSSVHVLDLTNGKTVYMFVDKFYPIRATLLERMLRHRLTVPPSYCRDVVVAGSVIQTVQTGLRQSYECLASAPL